MSDEKDADNKMVKKKPLIKVLGQTRYNDYLSLT